MPKPLKAIGLSCFGLLLTLTALLQIHAQDTKASYTSMAPLDQYLTERDTEIALARSAAPPSISNDAEVMVFGKHGYEVAVKGKNGFVCMVLLGWTAAFDDPGFWNPKERGPACFNPAGARSFLPLVFKKAELMLVGRSKVQMIEAISAAIDKKELPSMEPGAMCYMMSKQGHLNDEVGHWHPHLMFFVPLADAGTWGEDLPGSPVIAAKDEVARMITFMIVVRKWSDGTPDVPEAH